MVEMRGCRALLVGVAASLGGCVTAVPVTYSVLPGQGKTEANLRADDAACRAPVGTTSPSTGAATTGAATTGAAPVVGVTADQYYQCMASKGEVVVQEQPRAYPAYAYAAPAYVPYAYPAIAAYPYPYPYYGYGYGDPFGAGYFGPYVGFGVGFGYGRFYGGHGRFYGGHGPFHGGFHR